jgi:hypothetical protein
LARQQRLSDTAALCGIRITQIIDPQFSRSPRTGTANLHY